MTRLINLTIHSLMYYVIHTHPLSEFTETNIITDRCVRKSLLSTTTRSRIDCGASCSADPECRNYVFCSSDSTCKLYQQGTDCIVDGYSSSCTCYRKNIGRNANATTTCPMGYYGDDCQTVVKDCKEAFDKDMQLNFDTNYILTYIKPMMSPAPFEVKCVFRNGGRTEILQRSSACSSVNFNLSMVEYELGFGNIFNNYWIGFKNVVDILQSSSQALKLLVKLFPLNLTVCYTAYNEVQIGDKTSGYNISFQSIGHNGCGDSMTGGLDSPGNRFSTYDVDTTGDNQCSNRLGGGWWFEDSPNCTRSFLTGFLNDSISEMFWMENLGGEFLHKAILTLSYN